MDDTTALPRGAGRRLWHFGRRRTARMATLALVLVGASASAVGGQYALKLLIDAMTRPGVVRAAVTLPLAMLLVLLLTEGLFFRLGGWLGSRLVIGLGVDIRSELFGRVAARPWRFFHQHQSSALVGRIGAAGQSTTAALGTIIWNIVPPSADLLGSILVLCAIDWRLGLGLVLSAAVLSSGLQVWGGRGFAVHHAYYAQSARVAGGLGDVLSNIMLVKSFGGVGYERARLDGQLETEARLHGRSWMFLERLRLLHDVSFWVVAAAILVLSVRAWRAGQITTGDVVVVITLSLRVINGSRELALALLGFSRQLGAAAEAVDVLADPAPAAETARGVVLRHGHIRVRDVWYSPDGRVPLFRNFSLDIPPGQTLGILGESGAGKSTLIRLIQGLVAPDRGDILIDGQSIRQVTEESLAACMAVVTQEVELLHRSLRENIGYGFPAIDIGEIERAAEATGCDRFIDPMPEGYDTVAGDRGAKLSGGQRQRVALARALLKGAPILLLDEATSALDSASELEVQTALIERARGRTIVAVTHRLSTVMGFDRVIVLSQGEIVEDGSPRQLRDGDGHFAEMWRMQSMVTA